jgi:hypothetical protein
MAALHTHFPHLNKQKISTQTDVILNSAMLEDNICITIYHGTATSTETLVMG